MAIGSPPITWDLKHTGELWVYIGTPLPNPSGNTGVMLCMYVFHEIPTELFELGRLLPASVYDVRQVLTICEKSMTFAIFCLVLFGRRNIVNCLFCLVNWRVKVSPPLCFSHGQFLVNTLRLGRTAGHDQLIDLSREPGIRLTQDREP